MRERKWGTYGGGEKRRKTRDEVGIRESTLITRIIKEAATELTSSWRDNGVVNITTLANDVSGARKKKTTALRVCVYRSLPAQLTLYREVDCLCEPIHLGGGTIAGWPTQPAHGCKPATFGIEDRCSGTNMGEKGVAERKGDKESWIKRKTGWISAKEKSKKKVSWFSRCSLIPHWIKDKCVS